MSTLIFLISPSANISNYICLLMLYFAYRSLIPHDIEVEQTLRSIPVCILVLTVH